MTSTRAAGRDQYNRQQPRAVKAPAAVSTSRPVDDGRFRSICRDRPSWDMAEDLVDQRFPIMDEAISSWAWVKVTGLYDLFHCPSRRRRCVAGG
jgi:hypothetical protein